MSEVLESNEILLLEESKVYGTMLESRLQKDLGLNVRRAHSKQEYLAYLEESQSFLAAVTALEYPGCEYGELVSLASQNGLSTIVLTQNLDDNTRERVWYMGITDYIVKEGGETASQIVRSLNALKRNQTMKLLIVDDSKVRRVMMRRLLSPQRFAVSEASSGAQALEFLQANPDFSIVIVDADMPLMNGFELVKEIRKFRPLEELTILGVSPDPDPHNGIRFLKGGANDFLSIPYSNEEFIWRVNQNALLLHQFRKTRDMAYKDALTGLHNRRYLYEAGEALLLKLRTQGIGMASAMLDMDKFKGINDTYGHAVGDLAIQSVARGLRNICTSEDIIVRMGGDEFCVLMPRDEPAKTLARFEALRTWLVENPVLTESASIPLRVSVGISTKSAVSLEESLKLADAVLYRCKEQGRNQVVVD